MTRRMIARGSGCRLGSDAGRRAGSEPAGLRPGAPAQPRRAPCGCAGPGWPTTRAPPTSPPTVVAADGTDDHPARADRQARRSTASTCTRPSALQPTINAEPARSTRRDQRRDGPGLALLAGVPVYAPMYRQLTLAAIGGARDAEAAARRRLRRRARRLAATTSRTTTTAAAWC